MQRTIRLPITTTLEAQEQFNQLLRRVFSRGERFLVERKGLPTVMVSVDPVPVNSDELKAKADQLLNQIGESLKAENITLDDMMQSGREIRGEIIQEQYGLTPDNA